MVVILKLVNENKIISYFRSKINIGDLGKVWIGLINGTESFPYMWVSGDGSQYENFGDISSMDLYPR